MPVDARPTIAAPDDDPYLWLEEIDGERAACLGRRSRTRRRSPSSARRGFAADRDTLAAILDRPDNIPFVTRRGPHLYNFWKDASEPARPVAANDARQLPHRAAGLGDHPRRRCARGERERGLGVARRLDAAGHARPRHPVAVARRQRRRRAARVRHRRQGVRERRLRSARGQGRRRLARPRHAAAVERLRQRTWPPTPATRGRCGCGAAASDVEQAPVLFETTPDSMGALGGRSTAREATETVWFADKPGFFDAILWLGDRTGPKVKLDLPTDIALREPSRLAGGEAPHGMDGRRQDPPARHAARHLAAGIPRRRRAISRCCSSRASGARLQHFFWSDGRLVLSILDELKPVFEVLTPSAGGWARSKLPGLPEIGVVNVWRLRHGGGREQRRSARQRAGPAHAGHDVADRARQVARRAEAGAAHVQRRRARSSRGTRRSRSTASASPTCRSARRARPATRRCT